jgi:hypothetical protein
VNNWCWFKVLLICCQGSSIYSLLSDVFLGWSRIPQFLFCCWFQGLRASWSLWNPAIRDHLLEFFTEMKKSLTGIPTLTIRFSSKSYPNFEHILIRFLLFLELLRRLHERGSILAKPTWINRRNSGFSRRIIESTCLKFEKKMKCCKMREVRALQVNYSQTTQLEGRLQNFPFYKRKKSVWAEHLHFWFSQPFVGVTYKTCNFWYLNSKIEHFHEVVDVHPICQLF